MHARRTDEFGKTLYAKPRPMDRKVVEAVAQVASRRGIPRAQVALAWLLAKRAITAPIVETTKPHHLDDAVAALSGQADERRNQILEAPYIAHAVTGFS